MVESKTSRGPGGLTPGSFADWARICLYAQPPEVSERGPSDFQLNPGLGGEASLPELRPAAVLIPVVVRERLSVILTQRTAHLSTHAGQIAFPGGRLDDGESVAETALREAEEETGLQVTLTAQLHTYSAPDRDPRHHTISTVFIGRAEGTPRAGDDAARARTVEPGDWPQLAFDHSQILADYLIYRDTGRRPAPDR